MKLQGLCPMGCGETLHAVNRLAGGQIQCSAPHCPRPGAVTELLRLRDVIEHRVTLRATDFRVIHPLRERFDDLVGQCPLDDHLKSLPGPPVKCGVYLAEQQSDGQWVYSPWTGPHESTGGTDAR